MQHNRKETRKKKIDVIVWDKLSC